MSQEKILATDRMLRELGSAGDRLSDWEQEFMLSLEEWYYNDGKELTDGQFNKLEEVHRKYY